MSLFKKIFLLVLLLFFLAGLAGLFIFFRATRNLPSFQEIPKITLAQSTKIYDRDGSHLLYEIHGEEKRTVVSQEEIPKFLEEATIAIEDKDFYKHPAFSWDSILRAIFTDLIHRRIVQGGSTITQQLAKNAFLFPEKTLTRKIREIILAVDLERKYTKDKILWLYLNQVPYGSNLYGVGEAAKTYFGKEVKNLTLAEAALLAALPQAPSYYSPYGNHFLELLKRKNLVLRKMYEQGYITKGQLEKAEKEKINILPKKEFILAPHFVMYVKEILARRYGEDFLEKGGLKVYTTLDWQAQKLAEETIKWGVERNRKLANANNAGMVVQDARTGQVLAMVGSYDYFDIKNQGNFNICLARRQPGSAFKPFVYLEAFLKGYTSQTVVFDLPTNFDTTGKPENRYKPRNFDHRFRGPVSFREALAQSINVPSVKVLYLVGLKDSLNLAKKLGITTLAEPQRYGLSLVLGGGEVKLVDMVEAYSVFAQNGEKHPQKFILKVEDDKGRILENYQPQSEKVVDSKKVEILNDVLSDNKARAPLFGGENNLVKLEGREIAAKTGTTNNSRDAWIFAYTPSYVVGIWAGNNDNSPMLKQGSSILLAVPMWHYFATRFFSDKPAEEFQKPSIEKVEKPMLDGEYVIPYLENSRLKPQIHSILWYVDRSHPLSDPPEFPGKNPQFKNWEDPILSWLEKSGVDLNYFNQPISYQTKLYPLSLENLQGRESGIEILSPVNGDFIGKEFEVEIRSKQPIKIMEVYFNGKLIKTFSSLAEGKKGFLIRPGVLNLQNKLELKGFFGDGKGFKKELVLFKKVPKNG